MKRKQIRLYARGFVDEYTEEPEGLVQDENSDELDFNEIINTAQETVELDLIPYMPEEFKKSFTISLEVDKDEYHIEDDLSVTDFLRIKDIYHNESGKKPQGLLYREEDQIQELEIDVGQKGDPQCWFWAAKLTIGFRPIPNTARTDWFKVPYFYKIPDLNQDDTHDPSTDKYAIPDLPSPAHILVAIDAARQYLIIDREADHPLNDRYNKRLTLIINNLSLIQPSFQTRRRPLTLGDSIR